MGVGSKLQGLTLIDDLLTPADRLFLSQHRVARLATIDARKRPRLVPVCYVVHQQAIYIPLDEKPKRVAPTQLGRIRDIGSNHAVAFLVDDYSDDWNELAYLLIRGFAELLERKNAPHSEVVELLRRKYPQYETMRIEVQPLIQVNPISVTRWSWAGRPIDPRG